MSNQDEAAARPDEAEAMEGSDFGEDENDKNQYQRKEYVARPYKSPFETDKDIDKLIVKNSRNLIKMRVTKQRREFGFDFGQMIEKDPPDNTFDLKTTHKGNNPFTYKKKKVLEIGLQAANQMRNLTTQTYHNRSVNACVQYDPEDFNKKMEALTNADTSMADKLDKFISKRAPRIEAALQSNEIINVFQDDFDMLGDDDAAADTRISTVNVVPRTFADQEYCKQKTVSCIKFHPTKPHLVALSLIEHFESFEKRCLQMTKSFDSHVLILNFSDAHIITLNYILQSPVEVTCIEFHPEEPYIIYGGGINGQIIVWDLALAQTRITGGRKTDVAKMPDEEEDKTQQVQVKVKELKMSYIDKSHSNFVADIQFIPPGVKVDKKNQIMGKSQYFVSCSEDCTVAIWDSKHVEWATIQKEEEKKKAYFWVPLMSFPVFRQDGSGDLGLSRILFEPGQTTPTFYAGSDEGDLILIDWSIRPTGDSDKTTVEYVRHTYESERSYRPVLALERSPFYPDTLMTVHDFHFAIWRTSLGEEQDMPIFRSRNTKGSHNTCGAFSPTRPGVLFITKTDGIDVWDFVDQSDKPSLTLPIATSTITYFKFQHIKEQNKKKKQTKQYLAYGDESEGTLYLCEVPHNLRVKQDREEDTISNFWLNEIQKCDYVSDRKGTMREEWQERQKADDLKKALEEQAKDALENAELEKELAEEDAYQEKLLSEKAKLGLITDEELEAEKLARKKKRAL